MSGILIVPGHDNSGPRHWQSIWQSKYPDTVRLQQRDWLDADCEEWITRLDEEIGRQGRDVVLVGHSCGAMTIVFWGARFRKQVKGALLVAPTDGELDDLPAGIRGFRPIPRGKLPFPTVVVGSRNDRYLGFQRGRQLAADRGAEFFDAGNAGHINTASGFGPWPEGERLLDRLGLAR